ncbi:MAG: hypothetical protein U0W24_22535 [Bacteroidales bacterium]
MNPIQNQKLVVGYLHFIDLETGFWQLKDKEQDYRITGIPVDLQKENLRIAALLEIYDEEISVFMSGKPAKILDYKIIE